MLKRLLMMVAMVWLVACDQSPTTVHDLDNKLINFKEYQGKWLVINYWADWCNHCITELPELNKFYAANKAHVVMYGVNFDNLPAEQLKLITQQLNIKFPILINDPASQLGLGNVSTIPATFIINPQGKIAKALLGEQTQKTLEAALK